MELPESAASIVQWIFRAAIVKFVVVSSMVLLVSILVPIAVDYLAPWLNPGSLNSAFSSIPSGVWFFMDFLAIPYGVKLCISAYVTRFLIRRLPIIGG